MANSRRNVDKRNRSKSVPKKKQTAKRRRDYVCTRVRIYQIDLTTGKLTGFPLGPREYLELCIESGERPHGLPEDME